ncbi:hypothetical protein BDK51DRAFT_27738, partial [Blyttiomyces helicus]
LRRHQDAHHSKSSQTTNSDSNQATTNAPSVKEDELPERSLASPDPTPQTPFSSRDSTPPSSPAVPSLLPSFEWAPIQSTMPSWRNPDESPSYLVQETRLFEPVPIKVDPKSIADELLSFTDTPELSVGDWSPMSLPQVPLSPEEDAAESVWGGLNFQEDRDAPDRAFWTLPKEWEGWLGEGEYRWFESKGMSEDVPVTW